VLGYNTLAGYVADNRYIGATIGRFANRIGGAKFSIDGTEYKLDANEGKNSNHGGNEGFNSCIFDHEITSQGVSFTLKSKDGEGGYPGNLDVRVNYSWTDDNELQITFNATTDKKTVANFTNHAYFNLSAKGNGIFDHSLKVYADTLLDVDAEYIPTGLIKPVGNKALNSEILRDKMLTGTGFNDCYILQNPGNKQLKPAAELIENTSGRTLQVFTTYPSVIVYTGDYLDCRPHGNFSRPYKPFDGLCLECQYFPDTPNHSNFPSTVLLPGDVYLQTIIYKFGLIS
jgi:aldose 1-epimerase